MGRNKPGSVEDGHLSKVRDCSLTHAAYPFRTFGRATLGAEPTWPCSGQGLPCLWSHLHSGGLLPHLFTLTEHPMRWGLGGIFSVALSLPCTRLIECSAVAVSHCPALRSPDFPLP